MGGLESLTRRLVKNRNLSQDWQFLSSLDYDHCFLEAKNPFSNSLPSFIFILSMSWCACPCVCVRTFALSCLHLRVVIVLLLWFGGAAPVKRGRLFSLPRSLRLCSVLRPLIVRLAPRFAKFFPHRYFLAVVSAISSFRTFSRFQFAFSYVLFSGATSNPLFLFFFSSIECYEYAGGGSLLSRRIVSCPFFPLLFVLLL